MPFMIDFLIQAIGGVSLVAGLWFSGDKRLLGPTLGFWSNIFLTVVGITHHVWSSVAIGIVLFFVHGRNIVKWAAEGARL